MLIIKTIEIQVNAKEPVSRFMIQALFIDLSSPKKRFIDQSINIVQDIDIYSIGLKYIGAKKITYPKTGETADQ